MSSFPNALVDIVNGQQLPQRIEEVLAHKDGALLAAHAAAVIMDEYRPSTQRSVYQYLVLVIVQCRILHVAPGRGFPLGRTRAKTAHVSFLQSTYSRRSNYHAHACSTRERSYPTCTRGPRRRGRRRTQGPQRGGRIELGGSRRETEECRLASDAGVAGG
jgi:hypothetical protein